MVARRKTRQVKVGNVLIGGDAPVSVQSMTSGYTHDIDKCVREIHKLAAGGADIAAAGLGAMREFLAGMGWGVLEARRAALCLKWLALTRLPQVKHDPYP